MTSIHSDKASAEESVRLTDFKADHHTASGIQESNAPTGRKWRPGGFIRLPFVSLICLIIIIAAGGASIAVLLVSDGKDRDSWGTRSFAINLLNGVETKSNWHISVNSLLSIFVFVADKALAVMFAEAIAVSWWISALQGQSLKSLHFRWEASDSILSILSKPKLFNWVCVGTLAMTAFAGLEALLQDASSTTTALSQSSVNMTTTLASRLPDGFSGVYWAFGHDEAELTYLTPAFVKVIQDYTSKATMELNVEGCANASTVSCTTTVQGVGFSYACNTTRSSMSNAVSGGPSGTVFSVSVGYDIWSINLTTSWKDKPTYNDNEIVNETCILKPALVEYPVNISQSIVKLQSSTSAINLTQNAAQIDSQSQVVDEVINLLSLTSWETELLPYASNPDDVLFIAQPGERSVLGGIYLAFDDLFTSSISFTADPTYGPDLDVSGSFAAPFAQFGNDLNTDTYGNLTFSSPMPQLIANIREIMFYSSLAIVQQDIGDWISDSGNSYLSSDAPKQTTTNIGEYRIWHTVYKTDRKILVIAIVLMAAMVLTILPLYWSYWSLGREVSLSPLEMAKALHSASVVDPNHAGNESQGVSSGGSGDANGGVLDVPKIDSMTELPARPSYGSNYNVKELINLLGRTKVKYGEISPGVLGVGHADTTIPPRKGATYI